MPALTRKFDVTQRMRRVAVIAHMLRHASRSRPWR